LRRSILIAAALTTFLWHGATQSWIVHTTILFHIQFFLVGLLAADLYQSGVFRKQRAVVWDVLGILAVGTLFALPDWWRIPSPALTLLIVLGALDGNLFSKFLSLPWISAIGSMCYTIYLWHVFVMAIVLKFTLKLMVVHNYLLTMAIQAAIILPIIFFFSVALFLAVEKPCMEPEWPNMLHSFLRDLWRKEAVSVAAAENRVAAPLQPCGDHVRPSITPELLRSGTHHTHN
jgi:peptidoglycan/LPS O-acetylase OafA/YrhL